MIRPGEQTTTYVISCHSKHVDGVGPSFALICADLGEANGRCNPIPVHIKHHNSMVSSMWFHPPQNPGFWGLGKMNGRWD